METLLLALRLLLAAVFATAGAGKLKDLEGSRRAVEEFGAPRWLARPAGTILPVAELAVAAALVIAPSARWGALAAVVLLGAFMAGIARALSQGRAPDCHCFGQIHSAPAGARTLARNGVLLAMAAVVAAFGPGPAIHEWVADRSTLELVLAGAVLVAAALAAWQGIAWLQRRERRAHVRKVIEDWEAAQVPAGRPIGSPAPEFTARTLDGAGVTLADLQGRGRPVVLVFVSPNCPPCKRLLPRLGEWQETLAEQLTIVALSEGDADENRALAEQHGLGELLLQETYGQVLKAYAADGTPAAVVVDGAGTIASATAGGDLAVEEVIRVTLRRMEQWHEPRLPA